MHYHCEIIMPPTDDVEAAVKLIMAPFYEGEEDEDIKSNHPFWDFWVIGGRWAGAKQKATYDKEKLEAFYAWCTEEKITVSGLTAGKQSIQPVSQIPMVDAKWNEMFPSAKFSACPLFAHSNDQYSSKSLIDGDICKVSEVPDNLECSRVIVACFDYQDKLYAEHMLSDSIYNGCNFERTKWNGTIVDAISDYEKSHSSYRDEWKEKNTIKPDWLVVTVDYHS